MKYFLLALALIIASPLNLYSAECEIYEYAELEDMDKDELLKEYCKTLEIAKTYAMLSIYSGSRRGSSQFDVCNRSISKMERYYMKKYKAENADSLKGLCVDK